MRDVCVCVCARVCVCVGISSFYQHLLLCCQDEMVSINPSPTSCRFPPKSRRLWVLPTVSGNASVGFPSTLMALSSKMQ